MNTRRTFVVLLSLSILIGAAKASAQDNETLPARFTAFAVSTGDVRSRPIATEVDITINRWSTADEAQRLIRVLREKGPEALLDTLRDLKPVGTINTPGDLAYDLHFGYQEPLGDGGRRIFLATDRPISFWEAVNRPRVVNYPFTFIELRMDGKGVGEGKLALATKIHVSDDGKMIELENYRTQPIDLNEVKRR